MELFGRAVFIFMLTLGLCGCATLDTADAPPNRESIGTVIVRNNVDPYPTSALGLNNIAPAAGRTMPARPGRFSYSGAASCRLQDRFDRREVIAYNFADGQSRLGLKLGVDGFSLSDAGRFSVTEAKLTFRYRFEPLKKGREKCLYESPWQGLAGSGYNELVQREEHTVYEALDAEVNRMDDKLDSLFDR